MNMKTNGHTTLKKGMKVIYRGSWGYDKPCEVTVDYIELCDGENVKYGEPVDEVAVEDIRRSCFDFSNGHWGYGWQIEEIVK